MTIQERYEEYKSEYEKLKSERDRQFQEHLEYCNRNKDKIPRPTYRHFDFQEEYEMNAKFQKMRALEEFIN